MSGRRTKNPKSWAERDAFVMGGGVGGAVLSDV